MCSRWSSASSCLARILGVSLVQVETAGDAGSTAVVLRFLEHPQAEALRDHLLAQQRRVRGGRVEAPTATSQADVLARRHRAGSPSCGCDPRSW